MSEETKTRSRRAEVKADESAEEKGTNGVMLAMFAATIFGITSTVAFPNRQVETPASEATEQSLQQYQSPDQTSNQAFQQPIPQSSQQPAQPAVQPSILPSEPINAN